MDRAPTGQFVLGHTKAIGCGRPRGTRPKLAEAFIADCYEKWQLHGSSVIDKVIKTRPLGFLQIVASILPKDVNLNVSLVESMSEEELTITIKRLSEDPDLKLVS